MLVFPNGAVVNIRSSKLSALRQELNRTVNVAGPMTGWSAEQRATLANTVSRLKRSIAAESNEVLADFGVRHLGAGKFEVIAELFVPWPEPAPVQVPAGALVAA